MLEFFRKYQRYFFLVITVVVIASFTFFGTYGTFAETDEPKDQKVGVTLDGSDLMLSEVQKLSRFISTDREDSPQSRGLSPNLCNDGVIRNDFLKSQLAHLLVQEYFDALKADFASRLDKAKRFRPYAHPEAPFLSAKTIWNHFTPTLIDEIDALAAESEVTPSVFSRLVKLYQFQSRLHPEVLRRILIHQHQQYPWLTIDQRLSYDDLALFGFHSSSDWFGHTFIDLVSEFILNAAVVAEQKGYRVTLEEAKGDLIHNFHESMAKLTKTQTQPDFNFHQHLRSLGFDEKSAAQTWQKVLLFRRYFDDVGEAAFVDNLPYKTFAKFAHESAIVQKYQWEIQISSAQDLSEFQFYVKAISPDGKNSLPSTFFPVDEVAKKHPTLVQTTYQATVAEVSKKQVGLKATARQVWDWETEDKNWARLKKEFSLADLKSKEDRFKTLDALEPKLRAQIDSLARECLVDENPQWIDEALANAQTYEKTWAVFGNEEPVLKEEGKIFRMENLQKVADTHILPFNKAREPLSKLVGKVEGEFSKEKNPFASATKEALAALQKNPVDPKWTQSGIDPLSDQFKLVRNEQAIPKAAQESWMKEQAFLMIPGAWSPIQVAEDGQIVFFYLQERKAQPAPILDQISFGKETLAADAKAHVAEKLLQTLKSKKAIVIPIQKEGE